MEVVCVNKNVSVGVVGDLKLTVGKTYTVDYIRSQMLRVPYITDDNGVAGLYDHQYFIPIKDHRKKLLKDLLDE